MFSVGEDLQLCSCALEGIIEHARRRSRSYLCSFTLDGRHLVTDSGDWNVQIWEIEETAESFPNQSASDINPQSNSLMYTAPRLITTLPSTGGRIILGTISSDGRQLIYGSGDKLARVHALPSGELLHTLLGHTSEVVGGLFAPHGGFITYGNDKTIRVWDENGKQLRVMSDKAGALNSALLLQDGETLISCGTGNSIKYWNIATDEPIEGYEHKGALMQVVISPLGDWFVVSSDPDIIRYSVKPFREIGRFQGHTSLVWSCTFNNDGRYMASAGHDGQLIVWDCTSSEAIAKFQFDEPIRSCEWHPSKSIIAVLTTYGFVRLYFVEPGEIISLSVPASDDDLDTVQREGIT